MIHFFRFFLIIAAILGVACAENSSRGSHSDYENNMMFTGQTPPTKHDRKVNLDFFNKVCEPSGSSSSENGKQYDCHYTGD